MLPRFLNILKQTSFVFREQRAKLITSKPLQNDSPDVKLSFQSHTCGDLNSSHDGQDVTLCGWLQFNRGQFFTLRDRHGIVQVLLNDAEKTLMKKVPPESVLKVNGTVHLRPESQINSKMKTGEIEVLAREIDILGLCKPQLPFPIHDFAKVTEVNRLKYRYLDLRNDMMQANLKFRSDFTLNLRNFLVKEYGFIDVETPTLFRRTPGGAKEYLVPTGRKGKCYALTQSPQQFKQMLMVGSIDRYFQIARCYRDEQIKKDRQPEFTQLDLEMSFVTAESIMTLIEDTLHSIWPKEKSFEIPFKKLTFKECQELYGTDKPDLRHHSQIKDVTTIVNTSDSEFLKSKLKTNYTMQALVLEQREISPQAKEELKAPKRFLETEEYFEIEVEPNGLWKSSINECVSQQLQKDLNEFLNAKPGHTIFLSFGTHYNACQILGKIRESVCKFCDFPKQYKFLWVTDFPLFEQSTSGTGTSYESVHHPFTAPHQDDIDKIKDPNKLLEIRGQHYDLVLNGQEIGGGSVRINNASLQRYIFNDILKEKVADLHYFIDALDSGCPPHAGIALGLDRLISILCDTDNIRDVIAFPKSLDGKDLMSGAPCKIT